MSTANKTPNLSLPQYTGSDKFDLEEINKGYLDIDSAYKEIIDFREEIPKVNASAEIIEARDGEEKLYDKIKKIDSSLDTKMNKNSGVVLLTDFFKNVETNYTNAFKNAFDYLLTHYGGGTVLIPIGVTIANVKIPSHCKIKGVFNKSIIQIPSNSSEHGITLFDEKANFVGIEDVTVYGDKNNQVNAIDGINFTSDQIGVQDPSFLNRGGNNIRLKNVITQDCSGYGINLKVGSGVIFDTVQSLKNNLMGIKIHCWDSEFINLNVGYNKLTGVHTTGNNNRFRNAFVWENGKDNVANDNYGFCMNYSTNNIVELQTQDNEGYGLYCNNIKSCLLSGVLEIDGGNQAINLINSYSNSFDFIVRNYLARDNTYHHFNEAIILDNLSVRNNIRITAYGLNSKALLNYDGSIKYGNNNIAITATDKNENDISISNLIDLYKTTRTSTTFQLDSGVETELYSYTSSFDELLNLECYCQFGTNSVGYRGIAIKVDGITVSNSNVTATSGTNTTINASFHSIVPTGKKLVVTGVQTSGATLQTYFIKNCNK